MKLKSLLENIDTKNLKDLYAKSDIFDTWDDDKVIYKDIVAFLMQLYVANGSQAVKETINMINKATNDCLKYTKD